MPAVTRIASFRVFNLEIRRRQYCRKSRATTQVLVVGLITTFGEWRTLPVLR